jgi:hypothetical protein
MYRKFMDADLPVSVACHVVTSQAGESEHASSMPENSLTGLLMYPDESMDIDFMDMYDTLEDNLAGPSVVNGVFHWCWHQVMLANLSTIAFISGDHRLRRWQNLT